MSDPQRFRVADNQAQITLGGQIMEVDPAGPYVTYSDYARLSFKSECQAAGLTAFDNKLREAEAINTRLKAEVERLTMAGNAMASQLYAFGYDTAWDFWNAAKKGAAS
jgi:hypothetical protein